MPEVVLKFKLPNDNKELARALKATDLSLALWDMREFFFKRWKHIDPPSEGIRGETDEIWAQFRDCMDRYGIILDDLIE